MNTNEIAEKWSRNAGQHLQTFIYDVSLNRFDEHLRSFFQYAITEATAQLQKELEELRGKLNRECENHDVCRIQMEQLQAEKASGHDKMPLLRQTHRPSQGVGL